MTDLARPFFCYHCEPLPKDAFRSPSYAWGRAVPGDGQRPDLNRMLMCTNTVKQNQLPCTMFSAAVSCSLVEAHFFSRIHNKQIKINDMTKYALYIKSSRT